MEFCHQDKVLGRRSGGWRYRKSGLPTYVHPKKRAAIPPGAVAPPSPIRLDLILGPPYQDPRMCPIRGQGFVRAGGTSTVLNDPHSMVKLKARSLARVGIPGPSLSPI